MERFINQHPADGGGGEQQKPSRRERRRDLARAFQALGTLAKLFEKADHERLQAAVASGDIDSFLETLGITGDEADGLIADIRPAAERYVEETLAVELRTFEERLPEFLETHAGEWVLIHQEEVGGFFPTFQVGRDKGYSVYGNVPFLVQQVLEEQPTIDLPVAGR